MQKSAKVLASFVWCVGRFSAILRFSTHPSGMPFGGEEETALELSTRSERQQETEQLGLLSPFLILYLHLFLLPPPSLCLPPSFSLLSFPSLSVIRVGPGARVAWHVL